MAHSQSSYWEALQLAEQAHGVVPFRRAINQILAAIEFRALYFVAPVVADRRVGRVLWNVGFSRQKEKFYREIGWRFDPLPDIALNRSSAFRWSDAPDLTKLTNKQKRFMLDIGDGIAIPCTGPFARSGFVGVGEPLFEGPIEEPLIRRVQVAAQLCFQKYCALVDAHDNPPDLSQRELDVMRWIGEGKSNTVIAEILGITKSSVDSYVKRIFAKLGVSDRTAAAVKAVSLGLISAGEHSKQAAHRPRWEILACRYDPQLGDKRRLQDAVSQVIRRAVELFGSRRALRKNPSARLFF